MTHTLTNSKAVVVKLWRKHLGPQADLGANLFAEGGDSMTALRLLRDIEDCCDMEFDLGKLIDGITIDQLIAQIDSNGKSPQIEAVTEQHIVDAKNINTHVHEVEAQSVAFKLLDDAMHVNISEDGLISEFVRPLRQNQDALRKSRAESGVVQAAPMQRAYWIGERGGLGSSGPAIYSMELRVGMLNPAKLQQAVESVVARHEMLRLRIDEMGMLQPDAEFQVPKVAYLDCDAVGTDADILLASFRKKMAAVRFEFEKAAPFALGLARVGRQYRLFLTLPLWRFDAASTQLLIRELLVLAAAEGNVKLPEAASFTTYAQQWHDRSANALYERDRHYWFARLDRLPGAPGLPLSNRLNNTKEAEGSLRHIHAALPQEMWSSLQAQAARRSITVASVAIAAFGCALSRISGSDHFTLTCLQTARDSFDAHATVCLGNFGETLCIEVDRREMSDFQSFAMALQRQMWRDRAHMNFSGTEVAAAWRRHHGYVDGPTFPVTFTLAKDIAGNEASIVAGSGRLSVPQVYLDHQVFESRDGAVLNIDYCEGVYLPGVPEEILETYRTALEALADSDAAWAEPLPGRKGDWPEVPETGLLTCLGERLEDGFLRKVTAQPEQLAVITEEVSLTYRDLFEQAVHVAKRLHSAGVQSGDRIAIHSEKGWREIVAVIGVVLADMVYVPMHSHLPSLRKQAILESCGVRVVLSAAGPEPDAELRTLLGDMQILALDGDRVIGADPAEIPARNCKLAYILYTSGSTGTPKGVTLSHRASLNTIRDLLNRYSLDRSDRCLGLSQLSFDLSVFDIFGMLAAGGALVLPCGTEERNPLGWLDMCRKHGVTLWNSVPALMQLALDSETGASLRGLRLVFLSGDWVPLHLPPRIREASPEARIVAMGGATEAAIWSILHEVEGQGDESISIPYGRAMREQAVYVLDKEGRKCLPYEPSKLFIAGIGLAEGYWGDKEKTLTSFIYHPQTGMRLYDTGDLGRYWQDGTIEFLGRCDSQIKIQGYRIECGDVEAALTASTMVEKAVVVGADEQRGKALHAYIVAVPDKVLDIDEMMSTLSKRLPAYMIPTRLFEVERLPLSSNGKVDRKALAGLRAHDLLATKETTARHSPRTDMEKLLAREWADLLEIPEPAIDDDFFALGGTSFTGMMLMARISHKFENRRLSLAHLTSNPTIRKMAAVLDSAQGEDNTCLHHVGGRKGAQPLVLFPPIGGNSACYSELISLLSDSFDIRAVTARGLDGEQTPFCSIPEMGQAYAEMIADALPDERPLLVGWSMGGLVAIEVARVLGDRQGGIIAIDSRLVGYGGDEREADDREAFLDDIRLANGDVATMSRLLDCDTGSAPEAHFAVSALKVFSAHREALESYDPAPLATHATLVVAARGGGKITGLERLFARVELVSLDANHYSILRGNALATIAERCRKDVVLLEIGGKGMELLRAFLERVRPGFDEPLSSEDVIGQELGFSSIEQIRIIGLIEEALDIDLMDDGAASLTVGTLCALLEKRQ